MASFSPLASGSQTIPNRAPVKSEPGLDPGSSLEGTRSDSAALLTGIARSELQNILIYERSELSFLFCIRNFWSHFTPIRVSL